jgi:oligo-1,6-glucosidase
MSKLILISAIMLAVSLPSCKAPGNPASGNDTSGTPSAGGGIDDSIPGRKWWKEAIVYQIYPRSFKDSDGDGIGDLKGIISKLDYIKSLGVDAVWLNPICSSPNFDNGYDVSDYENIMKEFGTMADFDTLLRRMHERGLRLVMDLVVNHSSSEHAWFKQSRSSRTNPYRDYYHWWNAERGKPNPRYSFFDVNSDAWKYDAATRSYYLHYFSRQQPDLNWENPRLREDIYKMMRFWLDKGVDGFRMDAIQYIAKDTTFPRLPPGYEKNIVAYYGDGPHLHDYLREMNREVLSKYDIMTVAEGAGTGPEDALKFVAPARHELNMAYHFEGMDIGILPNEPYRIADPRGYSLPDFKHVYSRWDSAFAGKGWGTVYLGNHDQPRMVTRWGNDSPAYREVSAKMLTTFILTMRATPYYYYGDELGMSNIRFDHIKDYRDIATLNMYQQIRNKGGNTGQFLEAEKIMARDNARTPFQWDSTASAGFTAGRPWLRVNPDYKTVNEAVEETDSGSVLNYFRKMVRLRRGNLVLVYGAYTLVDKDNPNVYAYTRELNGRKLLVVLNFKSRKETVRTGLDLNHARVLLDNYPTPPEEALRPYEAVIYQLN